MLLLMAALRLLLALVVGRRHAVRLLRSVAVETWKAQVSCL